MEYLYIDESGSMTYDYSKNNPFFVISCIRILDKRSLKSSIKRFIKSHKKQLKDSDVKNKMFNGDEFLELKGSAMNRDLKKEFVNFLSRKKSFEVFYILLDNNKADKIFYDNVARAFNYMIKLSLQHFIKNDLIPSSTDILIQIDERNERPEAKLHLQEYLNTEFQLAHKLTGEILVKYYDSKTNSFIQLADFFANLKYSNLQTNKYNAEFEVLEKKEIIKKVFIFPPTH